jgi:hypothetical protein
MSRDKVLAKVKKENNHQKIISKFITVNFSSCGRGFWPQQMKISGQLILKYGLDFLLWCPPPNGYKVTSLVWFLTREGHNYLSDQLFEYEKSKQCQTSTTEKISLENEKIGEDIVLNIKPKTIKEFLNYG